MLEKPEDQISTPTRRPITINAASPYKPYKTKTDGRPDQTSLPLSPIDGLLILRTLDMATMQNLGFADLIYVIMYFSEQPRKFLPLGILIPSKSSYF